MTSDPGGNDHDALPTGAHAPSAATPSAAPATGAPHPPAPHPPALEVRGLWRRFGATVAVAGIDLTVPAGSCYGVVGPNGAGKTTTLSMATGLLRPDHGTVRVHGIDLWERRGEAMALLGVLPDGLRLFDRLTGAQMITYAGLLRGMPRDVVQQRTRELVDALDLSGAAETLVVDYSAGMAKKVALATAMVHAPRVMVLDEPFESVDPVSAANIRAILERYVAAGGSVVVSSHVMDTVQRMCDHVAIVARGRVLAEGTVDDVRAGRSLDDTFVDLVGGRRADGDGGLAWLATS